MEGFTLLELLLVVAVCAALLGILVPAVTRARAAAKSVQCVSNLRQVCIALVAYASDNRGKFPPSIGVPWPGQFWYDPERAGRYLMRPKDGKPVSVRGSAVTCPEDDGADRSYAMNIWASCEVDDLTRGSAEGIGVFWRPGSGNSSRMILAAEKFSITGSANTAWRCDATLGIAGASPGRRFGGGGGLSPMIPNGRFDFLKCELPYYRHRLGSSSGLGPTSPRGRVSIGYADGHVAMKSDSELVRPDGTSTLDSLWSPLDPRINVAD